jgi:hypothetical protein
MGFKDWFTDRKGPRIEADSIWLDNAARLAGVAEKARALSADGRVLALAHFPRMLDAVEEALGDHLNLARADSEGDVAGWLAAPEPGFVGLTLVDQLPSHGLDLIGRVDGHVTFLVAERHPLRAQDDRVERVAAALPYATAVQFVLAFDDPLLERFVGDRVKGLLAQLGMSADEEMSHPMISAAIERAQKKIAEQSTEDVRADSAEDWLDTIGPIEPR